MTWVVDTCVIIDVLEDDPDFGLRSARLLQKHLAEGLLISPVTHIELAPAFSGDLTEQKRFLDQAGIAFGGGWTVADERRLVRRAASCLRRPRQRGGSSRAGSTGLPSRRISKCSFTRSASLDPISAMR